MQPNPLADVLSQSAIRLLEERDVALEDYLSGISAIFVRSDDPILTESRAPTAHAASHAVGGWDNISADSINADDIAIAYMSGKNTNPGSIQNIHLTTNAVATSNLQDGSVSTNKLQDGSVTAVKVAADVATQAELDAEAALARNADNLTSGTVADARIPATIARDSEVTSAITTHEAAADPHTGYQKESEKNVQNGYAGLDNDADARVPAARLATGTPDGTKFLRDDRVWATAAFTADETLYWMQVNP